MKGIFATTKYYNIKKIPARQHRYIVTVDRKLTFLPKSNVDLKTYDVIRNFNGRVNTELWMMTYIDK